MLLSEGDPGGVYELLCWCERFHRYGCLLYCDDEKRLETLSQRRAGKRAHGLGGGRRAEEVSILSCFCDFTSLLTGNILHSISYGCYREKHIEVIIRAIPDTEITEAGGL